MKKTKKPVRHRSDRKKHKDDFADRSIRRMIISFCLFVLVITVCKLPLDACRAVRNEIVYFLNYSYDFKQAVTVAREWLNKYIDGESVLPVLNENEFLQEEENTGFVENGD